MFKLVLILFFTIVLCISCSETSDLESTCRLNGCRFERHLVSNEKDNQGEMASNLKKMLSVDFEVFGRVQGVFFRKYTQEKGQQLGLKGWVMNTRQGTVVGIAQGENSKVEEMKKWLQYVGSPMSKIDKCQFKNERTITSLEFSSFSVKY